MKAKKTVLDIDFIGGEGALTVAEEQALSHFFKQRKLLRAVNSKKTKLLKRTKAIANPLSI
jgi:hypothetical protein